MSQFRIVPVLDLLNGQAVHAIKGERANYKPLKSVLINSSKPIKLVSFFFNTLKFKELYIADLDAILKKKLNLNLISSIIEQINVKIMLDPGIREINDLIQFKNSNINKIILGLETIRTLDTISRAIKSLGPEKIIISLDLYKGRPLTDINNLKNKSSLEIIEIIETYGAQEVILLDLYRVGQKIGDLPEDYIKILKKFNGNILVGGGIKDLQDIKSYYKSGFSGVLIATALHDGTINLKKLKEFLGTLNQ
ncbi:MAG: HisA/HisF-related TIM barrel protein [Promethearchaeota archaeon]